VLFALVAVVNARLLPRLDGPAAARPAGWRRGWSRRLLLLGGLAFCLTLTESSAVNWGAVWLRDSAGTGAGTAAAGVAGFLVAMTAGRLAGDRLRARLGPVALFRAGAVLGGAGLGAALLVPGPVTGVAGLVLLGLGVSVLLPLAIAAAPAATDRPAATAVARVSTIGYLGSFAGPGLIGAAAGVAGLGAALAVPAATVAGTALGAGAVREG
jgi:fucose permease